MPPKARTCYICGRPTLLPGFDNHVQQCRDLFEKREMQKPPKERRTCPTDPMLMNPYPTKGGGGYSQSQLDAMNNASQKAWEQTLSRCQHCGRTFLPEKLAIHNRSCTASNPARRIDSQTIRSGGLDSNYGDNGYDEPYGGGGGGGSGRFAPSSSTMSSGYGGFGGGNRTLPNRVASGKQSSYSDGYSDPYDSAPIRGGGSGGATLKRGNSGRKLSDSSNFNGGDDSGMVDFPTYGHLIKCPDCGRNFNEISYEK
jgi:DNA-directed RNA polymerase subunit RPC12/RpoP